ncbi:MAG: TonB-dependent receptor [Alphaproteobacteria bacterium]|nr:TonB-dependent receptor [Alphaproteobacteria bacterium]MBL7097808.1 TonB-dependent receptor [Alphaproteobacteria bacterium]
MAADADNGQGRTGSSGGRETVPQRRNPSAKPEPAELRGGAIETVVVQAQRTSADIARRAQQEAPNLILIQTYQEIRKLPDVSVAEAVRRVPGVSMETDEGEGRYVNIRGFDADLNSTTFGGLRLPPTNNASPFGGYRAVTLDSIPIGLVGAITVTKSNTPDMDAEDLGGTIEITPKTAPPGSAPFVQGNLGTGYEPLRGTGIIDAAVTAGAHFGGTGESRFWGDGPFSIVATVSYYDDKRGIDDVEPAYFNNALLPDPQYFAINNVQQRDYELHRRRHSVGIDFGYQPDDNDTYYVRAFEAGYSERYRRQFLNLNPDGNVVTNPDGTLTDTLNGPTAIQKAFRDERETSIDRVLVAGGRNVFDNFILDYRVGYVIGTYIKPYDVNSAFDYVAPIAPSNATITYGPTGHGHTPLYTIAGADYLNSANFVLDPGLNNSTADNFDKEYSFASNLELITDWLGADSESLKFGEDIRLRHKGQRAQPLSYPGLPALPLTSAVSGPGEIYYDGQYRNGADIIPYYLQTQFGPGTINADPANPNNDVRAALQQFIDARENVYAFYAQYQLTFGKLGLIGGARLEQTVDHTHAWALGVDALGNPLPPTPVIGEKNYTSIFPSLQARYEIEPDLIARATWSSTLARPGFNQFTPATTFDLGSLTVTTGNPNLRAATANSFDVSVEHYLGEAGILSLGLFDKEISNYIVPHTLVGQPPPAFLNIHDPVTLVTFTNAGASYARGVEFNWEQHFPDLPGLLGGLGAGFNLTYVDSRYEIRPGEHSKLPSTSTWTWNAAVFYERGPLTLRLAAYSVSADLFGIGSNKTNDIFNASRTSMDFGSSYMLDENLNLYFNAKNLLNTPHAFYEGTPNRPIQREFYLQTYQAGIRFDF